MYFQIINFICFCIEVTKQIKALSLQLKLIAMALIKCSECGKEISEKAKVCPSCGNPISDTGGKTSKRWLWLIVIGVIVGFVIWAVNDYSENAMTSEKAEQRLNDAFEKYKEDLKKEEKDARQNLDIIRNR